MSTIESICDIHNKINWEALKYAGKSFKLNKPFDHCVIDNFLNKELAQIVEGEFPHFNMSLWHVYNNDVEKKKTTNVWNNFQANTYRLFSYLNSPNFVSYLSELMNIELFPDMGLHGGGLHIHGNGGLLNPHLDYVIHPKLGLKRKLNLIVYLSQSLVEGMGGELGLWQSDNY